MKNSYKVLMVLIAISLASGCASIAPVQHEPDFNTFLNAQGGITIVAYRGTARNVVIPEAIGGRKITEIGEHSFAHKQLTSVIIPDSVIVIGRNAFRDNQLANVTIPDSVTSIESGAFAQNQLANITIGANVTLDERFYVFDDSFDNFYESQGRAAGTYTWNGRAWTSNITFALNSEDDFTVTQNPTGVTITGYSSTAPKQVVIPQTIGGRRVTEIGSATWDNSANRFVGSFAESQLTSVTIPNSVTIIGNLAFINNRLTSVIIPDGVTSIGYAAFGNNRLSSVTIPDNVTVIENGAFVTNQLTSVTIGNGVTIIGEQAFFYNRLTGVTIPDSVTVIGNGAFGNNLLTSITIGANVTIENDNAFDNGFVGFYNAQNRRAGTYTWNGTAWSRQ